jgi:hypothetical protein
MTQQRTEASPINWSETPATWIALTVMFLAVSAPQWIAALTEGRALAYVAAAGLTLAAGSFGLQAARLSRARR